jgi:hypothetical protein
MKLNSCFSLCLDNVKFFDGMDDDGSKLNLEFRYMVLCLNSPCLKLIIVNAVCFFRYSKECATQQEPQQWQKASYGH